jgi:glycosyltransferase involved in cell wall biosynthesis
MSQVPQYETGESERFVPKRILLMGHSDGQGGAQTAFKKLCAFTSNEGHTVKIIVLSNYKIGKQPFIREELLGRIAYTGSRLFLPVRKALGVLNVVLKAWKFQPDIYVCVGLNNSSNLIARFLGERCFKVGQDFIAKRTIEDPVWESSRNVMDGLVVQAPSMLRYWKDLGTDTTNVNWLPCFPEVPVAGILKQEREVSTNGVKLGYFGRLAGNKGLDLLLSALADPNTPKNVNLDLWGDGQEEAALRQLVIKLGLQRVVRFLGPYPSDLEGAALIASYDAVVLCSTGMEGLPLILLESMAYGVPFLATNVGAIEDCCRDNPDAVLVSPTAESIYKGIIRLVQMIENGHFDAHRHQTFYDNTFSHRVMGIRWRKFFNNPNYFFHAQ